MSDVKARLAAAGWSEELKYGLVIDWQSNGSYGSCGVVLTYDGDGSGYVPCSWDADGKMKTGRGGDLVPLPRPVAALQCPPVQKLATSGPSITRPVPAVDAWVTYGPQSHWVKWPVKGWETIDGETRIDTGASSIEWHETLLTGPSDRGPWRPIGEVR